ncbi:hypothetical protein HPB47_006872 [Ixodes persulcatus]|uniref:Uncharacterized protein n=1 Tax=Ixodes persulcatus TaxID=34615 RepID=A0AC60P8Z0_IXOPE|nr:hypothetical protein HPB47_006872 [Ixodes persulcatus]
MQLGYSNHACLQRPLEVSDGTPSFKTFMARTTTASPILSRPPRAASSFPRASSTSLTPSSPATTNQRGRPGSIGQKGRGKLRAMRPHNASKRNSHSAQVVRASQALGQGAPDFLAGS